jgi:predicted CoA-binding protein
MTEAEILTKYHNVAVVGLSSDPLKPSCKVAVYLVDHGYNVIPINPKATDILGKKSYPSLSVVPEKVEIVDIFRRPEDVMPIVEEAIKVGAKVVWMQEGIVNEAAAQKAREAGLQVVMDKCIRRELMKLKHKQV